MMEDDLEADTAFMDIYGDLDELVSQRRALDRLNGGSSLFRGVQAQEPNLDDVRYEVRPGISESLMPDSLRDSIAASEA